MKQIIPVLLVAALGAPGANAQPGGGEGILRYDADGDGRVSREEFMPPAKRRGNMGLNRADADGDGNVSRLELQDALNTEQAERQSRMVAAFDRMDADGDGVVTSDEVADELFSRVDEDGDSFVTAEEAEAAKAQRRGKRKHRADSDKD